MMILPLILAALLPLTHSQGVFFFGPPAVGLGAALVGIHRNFPVASSIVSRRSSRQYSQTSFVQVTPASRTSYSRKTYSVSDHFYSKNHLSYYQPNVFHYQSTPWQYRWKRSADQTSRDRRTARLLEVGDLSSISVSKISDVAANVSIAFKEDIWYNDMIYKDQDDCSKRLICELHAKATTGRKLSETENILLDAFGTKNNIDIGADTLEFDIAAAIGRKVGTKRCELSYRRCETPVEEIVKMIDVEVEEIENIQREMEVGVIDLDDIENRLTEEDIELAALSTSDLEATTTTTTTTQQPYYPKRLPLLLG